MQLNETTARIDSQLDNVCKKIEKIETDTRADQEGGNLTYKVNYAGPGSKSLLPSSIAQSNTPFYPFCL